MKLSAGRGSRDLRFLVGRNSSIRRPVILALWAAGSVLLALQLFIVFSGNGSREAVVLQPKAYMVSDGRALDAAKGVLQIELNRNGAATLQIPLSGAALSDRPILSVAFAQTPPPGELAVLTQVEGHPIKMKIGSIETPSSRHVTLYTGGNEVASALGRALFLSITGSPGDKVLIQTLKLESLGLRNLLSNLRVAWSLPKRWEMHSTNLPAGYAPDLFVAQPVRVFAVVTSLALLFVAALALVRVKRAHLRRDAAYAAGSIVLLAWIALDSLWMEQQTQTMGQALERYANKTDRERLRLAPHGAYTVLAARVSEFLPDGPGSRVFVASADDFRGMRMAYELYPRNVFWERHKELPAPKFLRPGDFVLLVYPSGHGVTDGNLVYPGGRVSSLAVDPVFADQQVLLARVR